MTGEITAREGDVVTPGELLALVKVDGAELVHVSPLAEFTVGANAAVAADGRSLVAKIYGTVSLANDTLEVVPLVRVSPDDLTASVDIYPVTSGGTALTVELLAEALACASVVYGVDEPKLTEGLAAAKRNNSALKSYPVAFGTPLIAAQAAGIVFSFQVGGRTPGEWQKKEREQAERTGRLTMALVRPGEVIAAQQQVVSARRGKTVRGTDLEPAKVSIPLVKQVKLGNGVSKSREKGCYLSSAPICGYADFVDGVLLVRSPVTVAADKLSASLSVHPKDQSGRILSRRDVEQLAALHAIATDVDWSAVDALIATAAAATAVQQNLIISAGTAPLPGRDARIVSQTILEKAAGQLGSDGRIDYHERNAINEVEVDALVAERIPATLGTPGRDVHGEIVPAQPGKDLVLRAGKNVRISEDGNQCFATINGVAVLTGNKIDVLNVALIPGDVDLSSGNIHANDSAVQIKGTVRTGFVVSATGHVTVGQAVEDAQIESGAGVAIQGGIIHGENGFVRAAESVSATFAQNARIEATRDIRLRNFAVNSHLWAGGRVIIEGGKSRLVGGVTTAQLGIEARELGAESNITTMLIVGPTPLVPHDRDTRLHIMGKERPQVKDDEATTSADHEVVATMGDAPGTEQATAGGRISSSPHTVGHATAVKSAQVVVHGAVYPGVIIMLYGARLDVQERLGACCFSFDPEGGSVVIAPPRR